MDSENPLLITFNYSDIFFSYYSSDDVRCTKMVRELTLVYVYEGNFILEENGTQTHIRPGECVFLKRDTRVNMIKQPTAESPFRAIFMNFKRKAMREIFQGIEKRDLPANVAGDLASVIKLPNTPALQSLFVSLEPYFNTDHKPVGEIMDMKLREGVYALLEIDPRFYAALFDFNEPWKIDILDFLNDNYMFDLSMDEIASFTGRSLSTFKRDFQKISDLPPQKWLIQKRLEAAHELLREKGKSVTEVYEEVGFKNFSHFSSAFKKQYGVAPSNFS